MRGVVITSHGPSSAVPVFGNGADGVAAFDGATACAGATRVGSTYTLNRDVFYTAAVVSLGVEVKTNGFRLFASASILNLGIISRDGVAGVTLTAGAALVAGTLGASFAGGNGRGAVGAGVAGTNGTQNAATGGDGGNGGNGAVQAGGVRGFSTPLTAVQGVGSLSQYPQCLTGYTSTGLQLRGGAGGGGGGLDVAGGPPPSSGGGGSGGGVIVIATPELTNAPLGAYPYTSGVIRANGGNGAAAAGVVAAGGGGGGGGGVVIVVTRAIPLGGGYAGVQVNGGDGGLKTSTGFDGDSGNAGTVINVIF